MVTEGQVNQVSALLHILSDVVQPYITVKKRSYHGYMVQLFLFNHRLVMTLQNSSPQAPAENRTVGELSGTAPVSSSPSPMMFRGKHMSLMVAASSRRTSTASLAKASLFNAFCFQPRRGYIIAKVTLTSHQLLATEEAAIATASFPPSSRLSDLLEAGYRVGTQAKGCRGPGSDWKNGGENLIGEQYSQHARTNLRPVRCPQVDYAAIRNATVNLKMRPSWCGGPGATSGTKRVRAKCG